MQTIPENEEKSFSDLNRSITINNLNKLSDLELENSFTDLKLRSHMNINNDINGGNHLLPKISPKDTLRTPKIIRDLNSEYKSREPFSLRLIVQGENLNIEW